MRVKFFKYHIDVKYPSWPFIDKLIINTLNPHSFCVAQNDTEFNKALMSSDILIPDGIGVVYAIRLLSKKKIYRIAGADMHQHLLNEAQKNELKVFYMGASEFTLQKIKEKLVLDFPLIRASFYSPPFKSQFSEDENLKIINSVNQFSPDILFVGMTAPKQEKWVHLNKEKLNTKVIVSIGAVFDFYAGNIKRAPKWVINIGCEWLYRFIKEPRRMWRRYLISNTKFIYSVIKQKLT